MRKTFSRGWFQRSKGGTAAVVDEPPGTDEEEERTPLSSSLMLELLRFVCGEPPGAKVALGKDVVDPASDILLPSAAGE